MATYAVGDIQGCYSCLDALLAKVGFNNSDILWITGDIVNRGSQSLETLRFVKNLGTQARVVLGNHDLHLLAVAHDRKNLRQQDTFGSILESEDKDELIHWLKYQPLLYWDDKLNTVMTHAGIPPQWTLTQAMSYAREVEDALQSDYCDQFLTHIYGNHPDLWDDSLAGIQRLRCITNYLTRMRFCSYYGQLDLLTKDTTGKTACGFVPWFHYFSHMNDNNYPRILFGHWASLQGITRNKHIIALDTGCVWGGRLTLFKLDDGQYFSVNC